MNFEIIKLKEFNGNKCGVYSVFVDDEQKTLFDRFLAENSFLFKHEISNLVLRIQSINKKFGARPSFFKMDEGIPGDGVCALFDVPNSNLRLYCIRYGNSIIILGGGGRKPKTISAFQENKKLTEENYLLRTISQKITSRIKDHEIFFSSEGTELLGELEFNEDD
jgi:hypothetical protein